MARTAVAHEKKNGDLMFKQHINIHMNTHMNMHINIHSNMQVLVPSELQPGQKWKVVSGGCAEVRHALFDTL
jgi:hypothetical protein